MNDTTSEEADMHYYYSVLNNSLTDINDKATAQLNELYEHAGKILAADHMGPIIDDLSDI